MHRVSRSGDYVPLDTCSEYTAPWKGGGLSSLQFPQLGLFMRPDQILEGIVEVHFVTSLASTGYSSVEHPGSTSSFWCERQWFEAIVIGYSPSHICEHASTACGECGLAQSHLGIFGYLVTILVNVARRSFGNGGHWVTWDFLGDLVRCGSQPSKVGLLIR